MKKVLIVLALLGVAYLLGPSPASPQLDGSLPKIESDLIKLERIIDQSEQQEPGIKPDNEAQIVWADSTTKQKTPISFVYIHGFSASQMEGDPIHKNLAKKYGANLYLARLSGHGVETPENFEKLTADDLLRDARKAIAIGKALGNEVVVVATSMGGALALQMAAENPDLKALVLLSPCIKIYDPAAAVLNNHWGLQLARMIEGSNYHIIPSQEPQSKKYWTKKYRIEGLVQLEELLETAMVPATFKKVQQPVFLGYYFKDEENQDKVVSVKAMLEMFDQLGSKNKQKVNFPASGDHVIGSSIKSKAIAEVQSEIEKFLDKTL